MPPLSASSRGARALALVAAAGLLAMHVLTGPVLSSAHAAAPPGGQPGASAPHHGTAPEPVAEQHDCVASPTAAAPVLVPPTAHPGGTHLLHAASSRTTTPSYDAETRAPPDLTALCISRT